MNVLDQVTVVKINPEEGILFGEAKEGHKKVKVEAITLAIVNGSLLRSQKRVHTMVIQEDVIKILGIKEGYVFKEAKIFVKEQVGIPFWKTETAVQKPKMIPEKEDKPAVIMTQGGLPIYRQTFFALSGEDKDEFVDSDGIMSLEEFEAFQDEPEVIEGED